MKHHNIIEFLNNRPGYRKEGKDRLAEILNKRGYNVTIEECAEALREFNTEEITYNEQPEEVPEGFKIKSMWQTPDGKTLYSYKRKEDIVENSNFKERLIEEMKQYSPEYKKISRKSFDNECLLLIDVADLHIGKLASPTSTNEEYDVNIALNRAILGIDKILKKCSGFKFDKIILPIGNDILHTDTINRTTTNGTHQDTDGTWYDNFILARKLYVTIIEHLMQIADVHVIHCPSNHDYMSSFYLADAVQCWFNKSENITFNCNMTHRKYYQYGKNLITLSHGDGAKMQDMPLLMANEAKEEWSNTNFRYIYLHHIHHKDLVKFQSSKDFAGVTIEYVRSPSSVDSWHHKNGFQYCKKAIEAFIHDKKEGQIAKIIHNF